MHFRFSAYNKLMRVKSTTVIPNVDKKWDVTSNDWLVDLYSSQANPWFWKLHGWVDDRIEDWRKANGLKTITWKGTWIGGQTSDLPSSDNIGDNSNIRYLCGGDDSDS